MKDWIVAIGVLALAFALSAAEAPCDGGCRMMAPSGWLAAPWVR